MRILMLGWEFPTHITGGLGTACNGLTSALDALGHEVIFVHPQPDHPAQMPTSSYEPQHQRLKHVTFKSVPAMVHSPYPQMHAQAPLQSGSVTVPLGMGLTGQRGLSPQESREQNRQHQSSRISETVVDQTPPAKKSSTPYTGDITLAAAQYAQVVDTLCADDAFDVIHSHDWMTYPAGLSLARRTGKPLAAHVHSTEFDRAGNRVNKHINDIERAGMHGADRVLCVSKLTRSICHHRYAVPDRKLHVVYNGVNLSPHTPHWSSPVEPNDKIVLFLGRITHQKGPEYFLAAAKRVLEKIDNVKFVLAGSGDLAPSMIELASSLGIGHKVLFTGFLRSHEVDRVFSLADCFVMPSVSEPFGIAPLEALGHDVPVIISKQSGVAEILTHALKVDFWDIDDIANKIIAVLRHPPLRCALREQGSREVRQHTWQGAARECVTVYEELLAS
jgi:glycogen synthase